MSVAGISTADHTDKLHKKSFHRRNDSGELDVFEAARYFSGYNEALGYNGSSFTQKMIMKDQDHHRGWRGGRISLDMPMRNVLNNPHHIHHHHHHQTVMDKQIKDKKYKQPSSPGGRLASFLNSLFNQSASKKKKSKSTTQSMKDDQEEISPGGGRRKRRSSISHFRSSSTTDSKSIYSSSSSGFRTPPPYINAQTPTKSYKDLRSFSDHKQVVSLSLSKAQNNINMKSSADNNSLHNSDHHDHHPQRPDLSWLDDHVEKIKYCKDQNKNNGSASEKYPSEKKGLMIRRFDHEEFEDDGADSDSSSDLFELQNYDLGCYSSGLPVYETTNMDNIKRSGPPISNA
ncbi:hypothetical protein L484_026458 [Morus notabilis]|uniref:Protein BIG GRAIN 1-like E n=1 Tax=Morus notabilis TaxID=981085 RepID=W9QNZ6_9ROSA|nr:protein BIG GRAIN 1-like E [Morus notabilis]EXB44876.1 hypothetical protein L484_026458 [Morus notabilis]